MTRERKSKFNLLNTYYVPKTVLGKYKTRDMKQSQTIVFPIRLSSS